MKSVVKKVEPKPETYPVLKGSGDNIVLFTSPKTGVSLISNGKNWPFGGTYSKAWPEYLYTVFTGSVTLSND